jgi:histidine triad (HIT) family protein
VWPPRHVGQYDEVVDRGNAFEGIEEVGPAIPWRDHGDVKHDPTLTTRKTREVAISNGECIFCRIVDARSPAHLVLETDGAVAFLDTSPLFEGHVLVVPKRHVETLAQLSSDELNPFFRAVQRLSAALPIALGAQGTFVAMNNVVSQSVPHLHAHVVPRTKGDGLRGFFWPRRRYDSDADAARVAAAIASAL